MTEAQRLAYLLDHRMELDEETIQSAAAELRRLDEELTLCSQLKREYQERAVALACEFTACYSSLVSQEEKNAALLAECEQLRADAARYRWLMNTPSDWAICVWVDDDEGHAAYFRDSRESSIVDAAIDAAIAKETK